MENKLIKTLIIDLEKLTADLKVLAAEGRQDDPMPEPVQAVPEEKKEPEPAETVEVQPAGKVIEFTEVRKTLARLSAEGHTAEVRELINSFGVDRLSDVPQEKYQELMEKAEVLNEK